MRRPDDEDEDTRPPAARLLGRQTIDLDPGAGEATLRFEALPAFAQSRLKFDAPTPYADPQPSREDALH